MTSLASASPKYKLAIIVVLLVAVGFSVLGAQGKRWARRQADLDGIEDVRQRLADQLDRSRFAQGPTLKAKLNPQNTNQGPAADVQKLATLLKQRVGRFRSRFAELSASEGERLLASSALVAVAERNTGEVDRLLREVLQQSTTEEADREAFDRQVQRLRGDAQFDAGEWALALQTYDAYQTRWPDDLAVSEHRAHCQYALQQLDEAFQAYEDVAQRHEDRGLAQQEQFDVVGAARSLRDAARIRLWLFERNREGAAEALARVFSRCGEAFASLHNADQAGYYLLKAIAVQIDLIQKHARVDLAGDLIANHTQCAKLLSDRGQHKEAMTHLNSAVNIGTQLAQQKGTEFQTVLATVQTQRGVVYQRQGETLAAFHDFQQAAETFAGVGAAEQAALWQRSAVELAEGDRRDEAQRTLDRYLADADKR